MADQNTQNNQQKFRPLRELTYEQARDELVEVVRILELGQMSLEESLNYWERGEELAAYCEDYLDGASSRIEKALAARHGGNSAQGNSAQGGQSAPQGGNATHSEG
ncbi:exodeoxyribonuclease VII small subunit [Corynebacterium sp. zg254]|uniref:Exodeoxyribonuclease 7 small subunit n=1 Tax=Corynebacterium zhongnanshanii TaxID=2768834 RepID=A0ABQ6VG12_9CORY|nr:MULTISPECIES: exodeoxyribonuclease VII small subunit [Corynebacterium]KAB3523134.1 exodeoxyribonuclease VII small subunit [Corynebacterium zhongnanshanii]MCR5913760.1 exodeoxyribonuclease VII small subunit [Corynebacterium sp. zg254]